MYTYTYTKRKSWQDCIRIKSLYWNIGETILFESFQPISVQLTLDTVWSRSGRNTNENKGDIFTTSHVIFNGLKVNDNPKPKRLETLGTNSF